MNNQSPIEQNRNFWLFLELLAKRKKFILSFVIILTAVSVIISLILPKWYKASAIILPPEKETPSVISISEGISGLDLVSMTTTSDVFAKILESRSITYPIIDYFNLMERYQTETYIETFEALLSHTVIENTEEGLLVVEVEDKNPQIAADLTNAFVNGLDSLSREVITEKAKNKKKFFESRLEEVNKNLNINRKILEEFQIKNKTVDFDEQSRLVIEQAIEIKVALSKTEVDLSLAEATNGTELNIIQLRKQKKLLQKQLDELENGSGSNSYFTLPLSKIPILKNEYNKIYSTVKVGEEIAALLLQQLEQAKIQSSGSFKEFSILQSAIPPELKSRPKRTLIVILTFVLSLILSVIIATLIEYFAQLKYKSEPDYNRAMFFIRGYFGWLPGIRKKD